MDFFGTLPSYSSNPLYNADDGHDLGAGDRAVESVQVETLLKELLSEPSDRELCMCYLKSEGLLSRWQFYRKEVGLSFGLKNGLRFHFDTVTFLYYPFVYFF